MVGMTNALEAINSLPEEYKLKISKHCISDNPDSLDKALNAALNCSQNLDGLDRPNANQKQLSKTLLTIRKGLASELLRLDGFDLEAAKNRGKTETIRTDKELKTQWNKTVVPGA
jgi:hypothetical protein